MRDRYLDDDGFVVDLDAPAGPAKTAEDRRLAAIADCPHCDEHGYRAGSIVCDHQDHAAIAERHRSAVRAELDRIARRKETPATTTERSHTEP